MNLNQYLSNPSGKGSAILPINSIKADLNAQFEQLRNDIKMKVYMNKKTLIYKIDIPSRSNKDVVYDVILEYDLTKLPDDKTTINELEFSCFSNCPSFAFTYAYIFNEKGLLCTWLKDKYDKKIIREKPEVRNEYQIMGFERSLYIALKYISLSGRNKVDNIRILSTNFKKYSDIKSLIKTQEEIMESLNKKKKGKESKEKVTRTNNTTTNKMKRNQDGFTGLTKTTGKTKTTKRTKKI